MYHYETYLLTVLQSEAFTAAKNSMTAGLGGGGLLLVVIVVVQAS